MKPLPSRILLAFALSSCNSTLYVRSKDGSEAAYSGSFASKASFDKTRIQTQYATIEKEIHLKDEVEARVQLV